MQHLQGRQLSRGVSSGSRRDGGGVFKHSRLTLRLQTSGVNGESVFLVDVSKFKCLTLQSQTNGRTAYRLAESKDRVEFNRLQCGLVY